MDVIKKQKFKPWRCGTCSKVIGMIYATGVLSIKHKEFYCWISGHCKLICRYCGTTNTISTESDITMLVDS
jgi:hypothetical protein